MNLWVSTYNAVRYSSLDHICISTCLRSVFGQGVIDHAFLKHLAQIAGAAAAGGAAAAAPAVDAKALSEIKTKTATAAATRPKAAER